MYTAHEKRERWQQEAAFFDRQAEAIADQLHPTAPATIARYRSNHRRRFAMEFRYRLMGDVTGKRILDAGCGEGVNSLITGIDLSPGAIRVAQRRAAIDGVADRATFICAPLETADVEDHSFDIIWADAFLHHVLPDLEAVAARFRRWVRPGGLIIMSEPVNLAPWLRRLRFAVARESEHTPDERPLEAHELEVLRRVFPELQVRYYRGFSRLEKYLLPDHQYETAAWWRRALVHGVGLLDYGLLSVPVLQRLAGIAVLSARVTG